MRGRQFTRLTNSKGNRIGPPHFLCFKTFVNIYKKLFFVFQLFELFVGVAVLEPYDKKPQLLTVLLTPGYKELIFKYM